MTTIITKDILQRMINEASPERKKKIVGRALVIVFNNQTRDERAVDHTMVHNGIGFTGADAHSGSLTAKSYLRHNTLQDWQLERWIKPDRTGYSRICKYHSQINQAAIKKASNT